MPVEASSLYVNSWPVKHRDAADTRIRVAARTDEADTEHPDPLSNILWLTDIMLILIGSVQTNVRTLQNLSL